MARFCGKCGSRLDDATGLCPNCDADKIKQSVGTPAEPPKAAGRIPEISPQQNEPLSRKEAGEKRKAEKKAARKKQKTQKKAVKKTKKKEKWAAKPWWKKLLSIFLRCIAWILVLIIAAAGILYALMRVGIVDISVLDDALISLGLIEQHSVEATDADAFFQNNATIIDIIDADASEDVLTETQVSSMLSDRGFTGFPITCNYAMDGTYDTDMSFLGSSSIKHPTYETYHITSNGDVWTIFVINDAIMAKPVSYNLQSGLDAEVLFSETNTLTSYDGVTNQFYETIPNTSAVILKTIERIDADTLESLTYGVIDGI